MQLQMKDIAAGNAHNSRTGDADIDTLVKSMKENGLILPIAVRPINEGNDLKVFEIIDGHRRFAAALELKWEEIEATVHTEVNDLTSATLSLVANIERLPLHPVDQYEAFAKLKDAGLATPFIARKFAISKKQVTQSLALGNLHAAVLQAWKTDKIDEDVAKAFTLGTPSQQFEALAVLKKKNKHGFGVWDVRRELKLYNDTHAIDYVGEENYLKAGGQISINLFANKDEDARFVHDKDLLNRLYDEKHKAEHPEPEEQEEEETSSPTYADHADIPKPEPRSTEERPLSGQITKALEESVLEWRTAAYRASFRDESPAFLMLMVQVGASQWCSAFQFSRNLDGDGDWRTYPSSDGDLATMVDELASLYANCIDTKTCTDKDMDKLASYLDTYQLRRNLVTEFKPDEYFDRCNVTICNAAIKEMQGELIGLNTGGMKKKDVAAKATKLALDTQWLPPLMRVGGLAA